MKMMMQGVHLSHVMHISAPHLMCNSADEAAECDKEAQLKPETFEHFWMRNIDMIPRLEDRLYQLYQ